MTLVDIQNQRPEQEIDIDKVGIKGLRFPIIVLDRKNGQQQTIAKLSMSVALPQHFKGTHMSRFVEIINEHRGEITMRTLPTILTTMKQRLHAEQAHVEVVFPYFISRSAPVSQVEGLMDYDCRFTGEADNDAHRFVFGVTVPVTTLCPCSKAISEYSAHNQRGYIDIEVRPVRENKNSHAFIWIEELIEIAESAASGPVYSILKRQDEKEVTMRAYDNPVFVEDVVRNVAAKLKSDVRIAWFRVFVENFESIHSHNAFSEIEWTRNT